MIQLSNQARRGALSTIRRQRSTRWLGLTLFVGVLFTGVFFSSGAVAAQTRDHLTDQETELVRFYQELDKRIDVFIKAIDRRFAIINGAAQPSTKKPAKKRGEEDEPEWGELPKGTRTELFGDIAGILDEAITNLDDVSHRDKRNPLISRSLRKLTSAANGYLTQLATLRNQAKDPDEVAAIERVADNANQIIEVGAKLPTSAPEIDKKKKKP
jgi:hypothetical protein